MYRFYLVCVCLSGCQKVIISSLRHILHSPEGGLDPFRHVRLFVCPFVRPRLSVRGFLPPLPTHIPRLPIPSTHTPYLPSHDGGGLCDRVPWHSGSRRSCFNEVVRRLAWLVPGWVTVFIRQTTLVINSHPGQLSLAIPPWVGKVSIGDEFGHCYKTASSTCFS